MDTINRIAGIETRIKAKYVNVFSHIVQCESDCDFYPDILLVSDIEIADNLDEISDPQDLTDEYVELPDGTRLREEDGVYFDW